MSLPAIPDVWPALAKCRSVRLLAHGKHASVTLQGERVRHICTKCRRWAGEGCMCGPKASLRATTWSVWAHGRIRKGETIPAMIWRVLVELSRREVEGMPGPDVKAATYRKRRKLLLSADGPSH